MPLGFGPLAGRALAEIPADVAAVISTGHWASTGEWEPKRPRAHIRAVAQEATDKAQVAVHARRVPWDDSVSARERGKDIVRAVVSAPRTTVLARATESAIDVSEARGSTRAALSTGIARAAESR